MISTLMLLLVLFQVKHFIADYPLQNRFMLGKFQDSWNFVVPLLAHVAVHAMGTVLIVGWFVGFVPAVCLGLFDAVVHFFMDRVKASKRYLGRFKPLTAETAPAATLEQWKSNSWFWYSLGFDQTVHHLTHYAIIWWVVTHLS